MCIMYPWKAKSRTLRPPPLYLHCIAMFLHFCYTTLPSLSMQITKASSHCAALGSLSHMGSAEVYNPQWGLVYILISVSQKLKYQYLWKSSKWDFMVSLLYIWTFFFEIKYFIWLFSVFCMYREHFTWKSVLVQLNLNYVNLKKLWINPNSPGPDSCAGLGRRGDIKAQLRANTEGKLGGK